MGFSGAESVDGCTLRLTLPAAALAFSLLAQHTAQAMLLERDGAVASALLAQGMAENDIAAALAASEVSGAGRALLIRSQRA